MPRSGSGVHALVTRHRFDGWRALAALAGYLALGLLAPRGPARWERTAFRALNRGGTIHPLRVPQQLGTPWVLPGISLLAFWRSRPHLAVAAALALPLEKGLEVSVKYLTGRLRPAKASPGADLHDDAPTSGPSYPSGHAAIAFAALVLAAPYLPDLAVAVLGVAALTTAATRVHQGAHYPLDAAGGVLLGSGVGWLLRFTLGSPSSSPSAVSAPRR